MATHHFHPNRYDNAIGTAEPCLRIPAAIPARPPNERSVWTINANAGPCGCASRRRASRISHSRAASHLLGQVVRYDVGNVFNPAVTVACRLAKRWLTKR